MGWDELILHPVRLRELQCIRLTGETTAKDIAKTMSDVPRATVYRHLKVLEEGGAIKVVKTRRVRGATEKTYTLAPRMTNPSPNDASALSTAFHLKSMQRMNAYFARGKADPASDRILIQSACFWATDDEYDAVLSQIADAMRACAANADAHNRRLRTLSIISAPPDQSTVWENEVQE